MRWSSLTLLAAIALVGCSLDRLSMAQVAEPGWPFSLKPGQSAVLASSDLRIGFDGVVADSRCPKGEQCVRAGEARVKVWLQRGPGPRQAVELVGPLARAQWQGAAPLAMGHQLGFVDLAPYPVSGRAIAASDVVLTLEVRAAAAGEAGR